jgi:CheY-like chemotaxis protein
MKEAPGGAGSVVAAVGDLIFGARIRAAAEQAGVTVRFARSLEELLLLAAGARLVVLDLDARWLDGARAIAELRRARPSSELRIVAFVSHVRAEAMAAAQEAGADRVLARSAFVRPLLSLLRE